MFPVYLELINISDIKTIGRKFFKKLMKSLMGQSVNRNFSMTELKSFGFGFYYYYYYFGKYIMN